MEPLLKGLPDKPVSSETKTINLFHPHVPAKAVQYVSEVLSTKWIGQGPKVEMFEERFSNFVGGVQSCVAVGSGTDALHLAYILANIKKDDEVICPLFTCSATNIPLLYAGAKVVFADVQTRSLNIDPEDVKRRITDRTKAIVCVHHGGLPCDMDELQNIAKANGLTVIEDAAHALGASYKGTPVGQISDFTMFSFQAIKHLTTGDGGMLLLKDEVLSEKAKRLRWFGIDRKAKQSGNWENDITEVGYKYQMTDIAAAIGLAGLEEIGEILNRRQSLFSAYVDLLHGCPGIAIIGADYTDRSHAAWMFTVLAENRADLQQKLNEQKIESAQVHYRNDRYSIFGGRQCDYPNMDALENNYLNLPLHTRMDINDVERVCSVVRSGW